MLGFQLAVTLTESFTRLPPRLKWTHFGSLLMTTLAIALLMMPAAWHRLVERGEETERFHRLASAMLLAALVPLALGIVGDLYIVVFHVTRSTPLAAAIAASVGVTFGALWFGAGLGRRRREREVRGTAAARL